MKEKEEKVSPFYMDSATFESVAAQKGRFPQKTLKILHRVLVEREDQEAVAAEFGVTQWFMSQVMGTFLRRTMDLYPHLTIGHRDNMLITLEVRKDRAQYFRELAAKDLAEQNAKDLADQE